MTGPHPTFKVDFNEQDDYGHIFAKTWKVGDRCSMLDDDGNYCEGEIILLTNGHLLLRPDNDTWVAGPPVPTYPPQHETPTECYERGGLNE